MAGTSLKRRLRSRPDASDVTRRRFLIGSGAAVGVSAAPAILKGLRAEVAERGSSLFTLGVASGDPRAHSVVIWTRLAPDPLGGLGLPGFPIPVRWEVAGDPGMAKVLRRGLALATARDGYAVHAQVAGLPSDRWFYYRFEALGEHSRIGRTRTFPGPRDGVGEMRFALASCQDYQDGFYVAYRDMLRQDLDFVLHVGDYIYENGQTGNPIAEGRRHNSAEVFSVEDYRKRYALYRLDPDLQEAHARLPFVVTWDDHEADNNYAGKVAEEDAPVQGRAFLERRRNAYQVYAETMPLRLGNRLGARRNRLRLYRSLHFGDLADIHVLDTRQFRSDQPCEDGFGSLDPESVALEAEFGRLFCPEEIDDPEATLLGSRQERWLARGLKFSRARWNILAQQVMMTEWNLAPFAQQFLPEIETIFSVDAWDGYRAARRRLFNLLARLRPSNPVVLTGDIHSAWGANLLEDFADPGSDILAAEFVGSSITSTFGDRDPRPNDALVRDTVVKANPQVAFFNGLYRGYCLCEVDRRRWRTTYRAAGTLEAIGNPDREAFIPFDDTPVETDAVLEIPAGFNAPGSGLRLETKFARLPLGA